MNITRCRMCPAHIRFARTVNGRLIPLDLDPHPNGNVVVDEATGTPVAHVLGPGGTVPFDLAHLADADRWMPHHATCSGSTR